MMQGECSRNVCGALFSSDAAKNDQAIRWSVVFSKSLTVAGESRLVGPTFTKRPMLAAQQSTSPVFQSTE